MLEGIRTPEQELKKEAHHYRALFNQMAIEGDFSHGFTWALGGSQQFEISLVDGQEIELTPAELAVVSIGLSLGSDDHTDARVADTMWKKRLGIINEDNSVDLFSSMMQRVRSEHMTQKFFANIAESQGKIIPLIKAYNSFRNKKLQGKELSPMENILWGYIMSVLAHKYELRLYLVDEIFSHDQSWVDAFDWLFDNFSKNNHIHYHEAGYEDLWQTFLSVRDEIATKKGLSALTNNYSIVARNEYLSLLKRMQITGVIVDILGLITQSPPSASSHPQDPLSP